MSEGKDGGKEGKPWVRGAVWIAVGAVVWIGAVVADTTIVIRGTNIPWGAVVMGIGAVLLAYDLIKARRG